MATFWPVANKCCLCTRGWTLFLELVFSVSCRIWNEFSRCSHCTSATFARTGRSANMWCSMTARSSAYRWGRLEGKAWGGGQRYWKALSSSSQHRAPVPGAHQYLLPRGSPCLACKLNISPAAKMTCGGPCEHGCGR